MDEADGSDDPSGGELENCLLLPRLKLMISVASSSKSAMERIHCGRGKEILVQH